MRLAAPGPAPTHKVAALRTLAFAAPDIKTPPLCGLPLGAQLAVVRQDDRFAVTAAAGTSRWRILRRSKRRQPDFVAVAEKFLGTPYLWGGKTSLGLDCSGLVQVALQAAGVPCPRDSDMQERARQRLAAPELRRGDLVFWKGHAAIARDGDMLLHANAFTWASRSSRRPKRSPASRRRAAR